MRVATTEMPTPDVTTPRAERSMSNGPQQDSPAALLRGDGKTLYQDAVDSARAAGIALLASAGVVVATVIIVLLLILH